VHTLLILLISKLTFQSNFPVSKSNTLTPRSRPPTANLHSPPELLLLSIAILVAILTLAYRPLVYVNVCIEFDLFLDELGVGNEYLLVVDPGDDEEVSILNALKVDITPSDNLFVLIKEMVPIESHVANIGFVVEVVEEEEEGE